MSESPEFLKGMYRFNKETKTIHPITSIEEWVGYIEDGDARSLFRTQIDDYCVVSTVFLGLDHGFNRTDGKPVLFESLVFVLTGFDEDLPAWEKMTAIDQTMIRYTTYEAAEIGHRELVEYYTKELTYDENATGEGAGSEDGDQVGCCYAGTSGGDHPGHRNDGAGG